MELNLILHFLRNPWGYAECEVRQARLEAADLLEQNVQNYDKLRAAFHVSMLRLMPDKTHEEISAEIDRVTATEPPQ